MILHNQENILQDIVSREESKPQICPKCNQSYMFELECPACSGKLREQTEALMLSVRIMNMMDHMTTVKLYESNINDLRQLDKAVTKVFKQKESKNVTAHN